MVSPRLAWILNQVQDDECRQAGGIAPAHAALYATLMDDPAAAWRNAYRHPGLWEQAFAPLSLPDMFVATAERRQSSPLIDFLGRRYSYAETLGGARRVACGLARLGVRRGDRVGLYLPNVPHYVAAYYGALMAGATVVNFSPLYTAEELAHQVADSGTRILFTLSASALLPTAMAVMERSGIERLVVGSVAGALPAAKSLFYRLFRGARGDGPAQRSAHHRILPADR